MNIVMKKYNCIDNYLPADLLNKIINTLENLNISARGRSYSTGVKEAIRNLGFSNNIPISPNVKSKIHGIYNNVGLIVHLGNHFNSGHFLLNLQSMFIDNKIKCGVFVTQTKRQAIIKHQVRNPDTSTTGNYVVFERLIEDLDVYSNFLSVPLIIIAFEQEIIK